MSFTKQARGAQTKHLARFGFDPIISLKDAAALAGCHAETLKNEAKRGKLTLLRISERRIGVRESEFNRYLDSRHWAAARPA